MTFATWKAEFYPTPASEFANANPADAARSALLKWQGALPANADRHAVTFVSATIMAPDGTLAFDAISCALCEAAGYNDDGDSQCERCPLFKVRDAMCSGGRDAGDEWEKSPFGAAINGNLAPLLRYLGEAVELADRENDANAEASYVGKLLDGAADDEERNAILRHAYP